jgi:hypothetical protein
MSSIPNQDPSNSDIMAKLLEIDKSLKKVKSNVNWIYFWVILVGLIVAFT